MPRLRRSDCSKPGISRRRRGRGFEYRRPGGRLIRDRAELERIRSLAIPPAWTDVWVCADPLGHLQATGLDSAGRRQYLYHDGWRRRRDREKFERMADFAAALGPLRAHKDRCLADEGLSRERVLSCAVRLLDLGFFRIGSEAYAEDNCRRWVDVTSAGINEFIQELTRGPFTAKDFRTWNATVLAASSIALLGRRAKSTTARKRVVSLAIGEVARYLGNTPAVCRSSYVDPRVVDRFLTPQAAEIASSTGLAAIQ